MSRTKTETKCRTKRKKQKPEKQRIMNQIFNGTPKNKLLPICIRDGTPGFRAPEIILASHFQDSRIDVFNVGVILGCIMLGSNVLFNPNNDYHALLQFVSIYGLKTVSETAEALDRTLEIRGMQQDFDYIDNSELYVNGYENMNGNKLSNWIKQRIQCLNKENVNNCNQKIKRKKHIQSQRQWSEDLYDLLDK